MTHHHYDPSMPGDVCDAAKVLWERQGPVKPGGDDGKGAYTYCQHGNSHCLDSFCPCMPTLSYRLGYLAARGCKDPFQYLRVVVTSPVVVLLVAAGGLIWWFL